VTSKDPVRALVVDDEQPLAQLVAGYLEHDGFEVEIAGNGLDAVEAARRSDPDVVVLDLMLPGIDGVEVCRQIRTFSDAYIVMLTAKTDEIDTLIGLSVGADDYIAKPFSPRELVARIRVMLRRPRTTMGPAESHVIDLGDVQIAPDAHEVRRAGMPVQLTPREFAVLATLAAHPNVAFTRRQLLDTVWGEEWIGDEHVVDVHIANVRRKLDDDAASPRIIRTVRGVGYRIGPG
jgi:DNA-binding response OmpR family regulator